MTKTMDAAAKKADQIVQSMLPERPHHLSLVIDGPRLPYPDGFWFTGASAPLQYMTYVCNADRGVLLARPRYEICDEPEPTPVTMPVKALSRSDVVKKKMSIKDYQNRKKSASPTDADSVPRPDSNCNDVVSPRIPEENGKKDEVRLSTENANFRQETRSEKLRNQMNGQRNTQPKPATKSTALPEDRKRTADPEEHLPPQKRPKPYMLTQKATQSRTDVARLRNRSDERNTDRDSKNGTLQQLAVNGRTHSAADQDKARGHTASPRPVIQVNGSRLNHSESTPPVSRKSEAISRSSVPELLSPLHPSFERELDEHDRQKKKQPTRPSAKPAKIDIPPATKKHKSPVKLPGLLSPTLPPIVEQELARLKKTPSHGDLSSQASESPNSARKMRSVVDALENEEQSRPSKIVTLRLKKANAKRAKELLSLPSKSAKNTSKKERSISVEATPPPLGKKRPRPAESLPSENPAAKRSRPAAEMVSAKPAAPSTPLKHAAAAMSRVASTQSQADTPGSITRLTPGTGERLAAGSDGAGHSTTRLRERYEEYSAFGSRLKHTRDDLLKERGSRTARPEQLRAIALHIEMILAYMVSFSCLNKSRTIDRKPAEISVWESLMPHLNELKTRVRDHRELMALTIQMHAICLEEMAHTFMLLDPQVQTKLMRRFVEYERGRKSTWSKAMALHGDVKDPSMKMLVGPWTPVDDVASSALGIVGRWAERERVEWHPLILREPEKGAGHSSKGRDRTEINSRGQG